MENKLSSLMTERRNERTMNIDQLSTREIISLMNKEDQSVAKAVEDALPQVEVATEAVYEALKTGGRLLYVGAGTSGRLGIIDASECPPTFRTDPDMVKAVMAGGKKAMFEAIEGVEDNEDEGANDLKTERLTKNDAVIGIAASGRTPYVMGALKYANKVGAKTISLTCNQGSEIACLADHPIETIVGPEVITGSTRLKAATAHKMVLNMISTTTMIKLGKVFENLMVDLNASNYKLIERAKRIVASVTDVSVEEAGLTLSDANQDVKAAIVMIKTNVTYDEAKHVLDVTEGYVRSAITLLEKKQG
ncbi:N-acetylmuramic acid 6-phosphate etherase [Evansella halocellulosilytica]|uniref:N-acetylmuramic acid 6-phosphate etherase n=1 Tax=Evansella halocellulosilytica TaxID=2011013 RepID=UPI000BB7B54A|nr:N-acetylmuramic acid 6-phosphate etherase [Evansella halocellulosilytica]